MIYITNATIQNTPNVVTVTNGNGCEIHAVNRICQYISQNKYRIMDPHKIRFFFQKVWRSYVLLLDKCFTCIL